MVVATSSTDCLDAAPHGSADSAVDVLIVGAGPVGLSLALLLKRQHVQRVVVCDRQASQYPLPRAVALHHESRRMLEGVGLKDALDALLQDVTGPPGTNFAWRDKDGRMIHDLHFERPCKSGPRIKTAFSQPQLDGVLNEAALRAGVEVRRSIELHGIEQDDNAVTASFRPCSIEGAETTIINTITIRAHYVVGCDGANSTVRELCGFGMIDRGFKEDWLVCDLLLKGPLPARIQQFPFGTQICDPERPRTLSMAGHGRRRLEYMRLPTETKEDMFNEAQAWRFIEAWGFTRDTVDLERLALYTFRARWASEWRKGRVFLAGDAAHQTPPFLGQGLNMGLRDANALAWRLAMALRLRLDDAVLATYSSERIPHVQSLIDHAVLLGKVICETDKARSAATHAELRANPPPPLPEALAGRPGVLSEQTAAGTLALQRPIRGLDGTEQWLDSAYGTGWRLLCFTVDGRAPSFAADSARAFLEGDLGGRIVTLRLDDDVTGDYARWLTDELDDAEVVLVRPDFIVWGYGALADAGGLVDGLRGQLCGK